MKKHEIMKRKERIFGYVVKGLSYSEIMELEGIGRTALNDDLRELRSEFNTELVAKNKYDAIVEVNEQARQRIRVIWRMITDNSTTKRDVARHLKLLQNEEVLYIKRNQILGVLPQDPVSINPIDTQINVQNNISDKTYEFVIMHKYPETQMIESKEIKEDEQTKN
jgi:hypothetical protein